MTSSSGTNGSINFNYVQSGLPAAAVVNSGSAVSVTGNASGVLNGTVYATGTSVTISPANAGVALNLANVTATTGSITATVGTSGTAVNIVPEATLSAVNGNITIENNSTSSSAVISIGNGVMLTAGNTAATGVGTVNIVIDQVPTSALPGNAPSDHTVAYPSNGGQVDFNGGITDSANANNENKIYANGGTVDFYNNNLSPGAISLGKNVTINAYQQGVIVLTSLDLTDPTVTSEILQDISGGYITGTLTVNGSGVGVSGNFTISASSGVLASTLTGDYINEPAETVNLKGFTSALTITLVTGTTHSNQVVIDGTEAFIAGSSPSNATLNVTSDITGSPVIVEHVALERILRDRWPVRFDAESAFLYPPPRSWRYMIERLRDGKIIGWRDRLRIVFDVYAWIRIHVDIQCGNEIGRTAHCIFDALRKTVAHGNHVDRIIPGLVK